MKILEKALSRRRQKAAISMRIEKALATTFTSEQAVTRFEKDHGATLCEIVNEDEIYHLVRNPDYDPSNADSPTFIRDRRICGRPRSVGGNFLRCLMPAGHSTLHVGYGSCGFHENSCKGIYPPTRFSRLMTTMKAKGLALDYKELERIPDVLANNNDLTDMTYLVRALELLLAKQMNADIPRSGAILDVVKELRQIKAVKAKMDMDALMLDVRSVKMFIAILFGVAKQLMNRLQYSEFVSTVDEQLGMPINTTMSKMLNLVEIESGDVGRIEVHGADRYGQDSETD